MKKKSLIVVLLVICSLFAILVMKIFSGSEKVDSKQLVMELEGDWINEEFISAIEKTKSYMEGLIVFNKGSKHFIQGELGYTLIAFYKNKNNKMDCNISNPFDGFFDGEIELDSMIGNPFEIILKNYFGPRYEGIFAVDNLQNPTKITWENNGKKMIFKKVEGEIQDYVNRVTLAGKYKDDTGNTYIFGENKIAKWPEMTFQYEVGLDAIWASDDFIYLMDGKNENLDIIYCYEWKDDTLYIYNGISDSDGYRRKDLYVALKKSE